MAEAHSFVQVFDQGEMKSAYLTIVILMCVLLSACAYVYRLFFLANASSKETPSVRANWTPKPPGSMNRYGSEGPWFAADAETGLPCDNPLLYQEVIEDLAAARAHRLWAWDMARGETLFYTFGRVTVIYTVESPVEGQGSGCDWRVTYISHAGTVLWFYMVFARHEMRMNTRSWFTIYPP